MPSYMQITVHVRRARGRGLAPLVHARASGRASSADRDAMHCTARMTPAGPFVVVVHAARRVPRGRTSGPCMHGDP